MIGNLICTKVTKKDNKTILNIEVELDSLGQPSSTGKMNMLFTSGGWSGINPSGIENTNIRGLKMNLSVGTKR